MIKESLSCQPFLLIGDTPKTPYITVPKQRWLCSIPATGAPDQALAVELDFGKKTKLGLGKHCGLGHNDYITHVT